MEPVHVVTAFIERQGKVLLLRRSREVGTYPGRWAGVSGYVEKSPPRQALVEIEEETGYLPDEVELLRTGEPVVFEDEDLGVEWVVHPFLFRLRSDKEPSLQQEHIEAEWAEPGSLDERETVPRLSAALRRVWNGREPS